MCFHLVLCHTELTAGSTMPLGPGLLQPRVHAQVQWSHRALLCLAQVSSSLLSVSHALAQQVSHFFVSTIFSPSSVFNCACIAIWLFCLLGAAYMSDSPCTVQLKTGCIFSFLKALLLMRIMGLLIPL